VNESREMDLEPKEVLLERGRTRKGRSRKRILVSVHGRQTGNADQISGQGVDGQYALCGKRTGRKKRERGAPHYIHAHQPTTKKRTPKKKNNTVGLVGCTAAKYLMEEKKGVNDLFDRPS